MSGWPRRLALAAGAVSTIMMTSGCARATPTQSAAAITAEEEEKLFAAYSTWRRAVTCATSWAPGPIAGVEAWLAEGEGALRRLEAAEHDAFLARLDARYRDIESRIEWVCGDGAGLTPPETAQQRLANLETAAKHLGQEIDAAIADR